MKRFSSILFVLALIGSVRAQTIVRGVVFDENVEAITRANIYIENTYDGTSSDLDGKSEFKTSEEGLHRLRVEFVGFEPIITDVVLNGRLLENRFVMKRRSINRKLP